MNKFIGRMLELGAELDKTVDPIEISIVINCAEILYRSHIDQLNIPIVSKSSTCKNCNGWGYTVDKNGRRTEYCDVC